MPSRFTASVPRTITHELRGQSEAEMSTFKRFSNTVSSYVWPRKKRTRSKSPASKKQEKEDEAFVEREIQKAVKRAEEMEREMEREEEERKKRIQSLSSNVNSDTIVVKPKNTKKRKASPQSTEGAANKARISLEDENDDLEGLTLLTSTSKVSRWQEKDAINPKTKVDRKRMPPPVLKKRGRSPEKAGSPRVKYPQLPDLDDEDSKSHRGKTPSRSTRATSSPIDIESMSLDLRARYLDAMKLPENSGIWAEVERDLFFRLALRGFEPLLPPNWMIDFPTYPLALFSNDNSPPPLLQSMSGNDFRATKALKELGEMGKRIRDRTLGAPSSSGPLRPEPIISSTVTSYIDWALTDAKVHPSQRTAALPVHIMNTLQKNQSTHNAITSLTAELHDLAAQHRERRGIRSSVERDNTPGSDATQILDDDGGLPVLTGILICSSLVVVVTLNAHAVLPDSFSDAQDESALRFIASFDFSEAGMDVWNALAVAITGMHVRNMMLAQWEIARDAGECEVGGEWELVEQKGEGDDPDA